MARPSANGFRARSRQRRGQRKIPRLYPSYPIKGDTKEGGGAKGDNAALADAVPVSRTVATRSMLRCNMSSRNPCCSAQCRPVELEPAAPSPRAAPPGPAPPQRSTAPPQHSPRPASPRAARSLYRTPQPRPCRSVPARARRPAPDRQGGEGRGSRTAEKKAPPRLGVLTRSAAEATGMSSRLARRRCRDV